MTAPKLYTHDGKTQTIDEWAAEYGIPRSTLYGRMHKYGMTFEQALTVDPNRKRGWHKHSQYFDPK